MKKVLVFLILGLAAYWAHINKAQLLEQWNKITNNGAAAESADGTASNDESASEQLDTSPDTPPSEAPKPTPGPKPAAPKVEANTLPPNVYYAKERLTAVTEAGVASIPKGTRVEKVGEEQGKVLVDSGSTKLLTDEWRLTQDPVEVAALIQEISPTPVTAGRPGSKSPVASRTATSPSSTDNASRLAKRREIQGQIENLDRQLSLLRNAHYQESVAASSASVRGRPSSTFRANMEKYNAQILALEGQRSSLVSSLSQVR